jgi:hypothetical protein
MKNLSALLHQHVVLPLNELGIPIDLRGVQAVLVLSPILIVVLAFAHASWKKRKQMRDLE